MTKPYYFRFIRRCLGSFVILYLTQFSKLSRSKSFPETLRRRYVGIKATIRQTPQGINFLRHRVVDQFLRERTVARSRRPQLNGLKTTLSRQLTKVLDLLKGSRRLFAGFTRQHRERQRMTRMQPGLKTVILCLGRGDLQKGCPDISVELLASDNHTLMKKICCLPPSLELVKLYRCWELFYWDYYEGRGFDFRSVTNEDEEYPDEILNEDDEDPDEILNEDDEDPDEIAAAGITHISEYSGAELSELDEKLKECFNKWLSCEEFTKIEKQLRDRLGLSENIIIVVETEDEQIRKLPWRQWKFVEDHPKAGVTISGLTREDLDKSSLPEEKNAVNILCIIGNNKNIDTTDDINSIKKIQGVSTTFLYQPSSSKLKDQLWENSYDYLLFSGHSSSKAGGVIKINDRESLTIKDLRAALKKAIENGLKLAIFNSCDGLKLASDLADLNIPAVIVMRDPVPDKVAQNFLNYFIQDFFSGNSLDASVRKAAERLQLMEKEFPCASGLPTLVWNRAEELPRPRTPIWGRLRLVLCASLLVTSLLMWGRHQGKLQTWELQAFDYSMLMQLQQVEKPDNRILVVRITKDDINDQPQKDRGLASLSELTLETLLKKLEEEDHKPRVIGLDIYRPLPVNSRYINLKANFQRNDRLIVVCKGNTPQDPGASPPPEVPQKRIGFSDFVLDEDNIIRRHLLLMEPVAPCQAMDINKNDNMEAFSVKLALSYLKKQGITRQDGKNDEFLKIGDVIFKDLEIGFGGYQRSDSYKDMDGHQVMLNYRHYRDYLNDIAKSLTLKEVLNNQFNTADVRDRIVLIGGDVETDLYYTPFSNQKKPPEPIPGVFIHAQMVSHILSVVLKERPLIWAWSWWGDTLWVWSWSLIGGVLVWRVRSLLRLGLATGAALVILNGICFVFLTQGGWIPLVPSAIALLTTAGSIVVYSAFFYNDFGRHLNLKLSLR